VPGKAGKSEEQEKPENQEKRRNGKVGRARKIKSRENAGSHSLSRHFFSRTGFSQVFAFPVSSPFLSPDLS
jgi:hypothetical protein